MSRMTRSTLIIFSMIVFSTNGHSQNLVIEGALSPSWSPDGSEIVCWSEGGILRVSLTGASVDTIVSSTAEEEIGLAQWHPDGRHLVYLLRPSNTGNYHVAVHDLEGDPRVTWPVPGLWDDPGITLTPDGGELLFSDSSDQVWAVDLENGHVRFVLDGQCAEVSPDGSWIAFATTASDDATIAVRPATGGEPVLLGGGFFPHWAPDSAHLVYTNASGALVLASRDGTSSQMLRSSGNWCIAGPISSGWQLAYTECLTEFGPCSIWSLEISPPTAVAPASWGGVKRIYR